MTLRSAATLKVLLILAVLYGLSTVLFSAWTLGITVDEDTYHYYGLKLLNEGLENKRAGETSIENMGFPPLAMWLGAWIPNFFGLDSPFAFRLASSLIYGFTGIGVSAFLFLSGNRVASLVFTILYFLCPNLKAMASLNVTDMVCAAFILLSASTILFSWRARSKVSSIGQMGLISFANCCLGFAICSKISGLFYAGFVGLVSLLLPRWERKESWLTHCLIVLCAGASLALSILLAYRNDVDAFASLLKILEVQSEHGNSGNHPTFFLGQTISTGVWYFYVVSLLYKSPFPILAMLFMGFLLTFRNRRGLYPEIILLWLPALLLFVVLSMGKVQTGLRYFLPGLVLIYLGVALALQEEWKNVARMGKKLMVGVLALSFVALCTEDILTVTKNTYLSYFNFLSPNPTRTFADSNNDWGQGIPSHLKSSFPSYLEDLSLYWDLRAKPQEGPLFISVGASSLNGLWSERAPILRAISPRWKVAGNEIFELSREKLFSLTSLFDLKASPEEFCSGGLRPLTNREEGQNFGVEGGIHLVTLLTHPRSSAIVVKLDGTAVPVIRSFGPENIRHPELPIEWRFWIRSEPRTIHYVNIDSQTLGPVLITSRECIAKPRFASSSGT